MIPRNSRATTRERGFACLRLDISATAARGRRAGPSVRWGEEMRRRAADGSGGSAGEVDVPRARLDGGPAGWSGLGSARHRTAVDSWTSVRRRIAAIAARRVAATYYIARRAKLPATLAGFQWETIFIRSPTASEQSATFLEIVRARLA